MFGFYDTMLRFGGTMICKDTTIYDIQNEQFLLRIFESKAEFNRRDFTPHHHSAFEISYIKSGRGVYRIGEREVEIHQGDIYLFSTNEVHCITEIHDNSPMVLLNIHFVPRFIWSPSGNALDRRFLRIFLDRGENFFNRLDRNNPTTAKVADLILQMQEEADSRSEAYELMLKTYLLNILVLLIRNYNYVSKSAADTFRSEKLILMESTLRYIDENITAALTLEELAKKAGMSRTYFSSVFKSLNGLTPWEYIGLKRIERAKRLLLTSDKSVLEISLDCGFNSISQFNRQFKHITGRTPLEYKISNTKKG